MTKRIIVLSIGTNIRTKLFLAAPQFHAKNASIVTISSPTQNMPPTLTSALSTEPIKILILGHGGENTPYLGSVDEKFNMDIQHLTTMIVSCLKIMHAEPQHPIRISLLACYASANNEDSIAYKINEALKKTNFTNIRIKARSGAIYPLVFGHKLGFGGKHYFFTGPASDVSKKKTFFHLNRSIIMAQQKPGSQIPFMVVAGVFQALMIAGIVLGSLSLAGIIPLFISIQYLSFGVLLPIELISIVFLNQKTWFVAVPILLITCALWVIPLVAPVIVGVITLIVLSSILLIATTAISITNPLSLKSTGPQQAKIHKENNVSPEDTLTLEQAPYCAPVFQPASVPPQESSLSAAATAPTI
jgi:hypothetical protein